MAPIAFAVPPESLLPEPTHSGWEAPPPEPVASPERALEISSVVGFDGAVPTDSNDATRDDEGVVEIQLSSRGENASLHAMTVKELRAVAHERGVSLHGVNNKKQLLQRLTNAD